MKKTITGMLALATIVVGMSAFKSADVKAVKSTDSIAVAVDSLAATDSLVSIDSLRAVEGGSITGKISPADGATEVEAAMGEEKLKGAIAEGSFAIPAAKAGTYTITVLAKAPYKNAVIKDVKVEDGKATDLGEIKLEQ
ncbi:carboxypeptidase regulatory-like domain-containing protein [Chitinophaga sp. MM2321]|uniref:carboxypeptidase regulatory-like domain-containing protein n=1 Tax=Chitinophaga sp. MM2321 TaxID=3137178 RepID=UPI0032D5A5EC